VLAADGTLQYVQVTAAHAYGEEGSYTATATVTDPATQATSTGSTALTVADAALSGEGQAVTAEAGRATGAVALGTFTDDNPRAATADFDPNDPSADYTVSIDWGDHSGTDTSSGTVQEGAEGGFDVQGSHTYTTAGSYTVTATVTDDGGKQAALTGTATVTAPWAALGTAGSETDDPERAFLLSEGEATLDLAQGALRLSQPLDFDQSPGTAVGGDPALVYNSATVDVRPVVRLLVAGDPSAPAATQAQVTLTWAGTQQSPV
jgi:PKD repeat protein